MPRFLPAGGLAPQTPQRSDAAAVIAEVVGGEAEVVVQAHGVRREALGLVVRARGVRHGVVQAGDSAST